MAESEIKVPYDWSMREPWLRLPFPREEYQERLARVQALLDQHGAEGLIVYGQGLDPSLRYLTNLQSQGGESALALTRDGRGWISTTWLLHGEPMHSMVWESWVETFEPASDGADMLGKAVAWLAADDVTERVAVAGAASMPARAWAAVRARLGSEPVVLDAALLDLRVRKSEREIEYLRSACRIAGSGIRAAMDAVAPGVTEREVAKEAHAEMFRAGAEALAFGTAVVAGPRAGLKHASASDRPMRAGELVFLDMGAVFEGYHADLSRCVTVGEPGRDERTMLERAEEIFHAMLEAMAPGAPVTELSRIYEEMTSRAGFAEEVMPAAFGHGVGMSLFERPLMGRGSRDVLEAGMTFAFEPMLVRYGVGTAVVEETLLITEQGAEVLSGLGTRIYTG